MNTFFTIIHIKGKEFRYLQLIISIHYVNLLLTYKKTCYFSMKITKKNTKMKFIYIYNFCLKLTLIDAIQPTSAIMLHSI